MLGDLSGVSKIFVITGRTDMRKSFDGLMAIIRDTYELDPYANAVYLFCGRDSRKLKALHFDKDGFVLLQKRLDGNGRFQWPRNASEARLLTRQEFRWLMEGLSIDQPKAIKGTGRKKISDPLCKTENFKFSISVTAGSRQTLIHCFLFPFECDVDETQKHLF